LIELISLDLDGTLLTPEGTITPASREAIARARAAGVRVVINTGRSAQEGIWFARETGCDTLLSATGGALVVDGGTGKILRRWEVTGPSARHALELCTGWDAQLMVFAGGEVLVTPECKRYLEDCYPYPAFHEAAVVTEDFWGYMTEHSLSLVKIYGDMGHNHCPVEQLAALPGVALTTSSDHDFELTAGGIDKGRALAVIAGMYGIPLDRCAAVGDSENDLGALRVVGTPIAMDNAPPNVKDAALRIAPSNAQEGVAWAILSCLASLDMGTG